MKGTQLRATTRHRTPMGFEVGSSAAARRRRRAQSGGVASCRTLRQVPDAHQVVDRQAKDEHPSDAPTAAMARLPHQPDGPWKFTVGFPGSSGVTGGASLRLKLLRLAQASISVPSTVKCSSDSRPRGSAWARTRLEEGARNIAAEQPLPILG